MRSPGGTGDEAFIAVSSANLDIARGTFVTIVGPSGCGKSSLLLAIAGLVQPAGGRVRGQRQTGLGSGARSRSCVSGFCADALADGA